MSSTRLLPGHAVVSAIRSSHMNMSTFLAFIAGILLGYLIRHGDKQKDSHHFGPRRGMVLQLNDVPFRNTSHVDDVGRPIVKQQLIEPFAIPNFVGVSIATFSPGQTMMPVHEHKSLHEFFFVISGKGIIQKDGVDHKVTAGTFLHMAPLEKHGIWIPNDYTQDMKMLVCGVTVGPN